MARTYTFETPVDHIQMSGLLHVLHTSKSVAKREAAHATLTQMACKHGHIQVMSNSYFYDGIGYVMHLSHDTVCSKCEVAPVQADEAEESVEVEAFDDATPTKETQENNTTIVIEGLDEEATEIAVASDEPQHEIVTVTHHHGKGLSFFSWHSECYIAKTSHEDVRRFPAYEVGKATNGVCMECNRRLREPAIPLQRQEELQHAEKESLPVGRPSQGKEHVGFTVDKEIADALRGMQHGAKSRLANDLFRQHLTSDTPLTQHELIKRLSAGASLTIGKWTLQREVTNEGTYAVSNGLQIYREQQLADALVVIATLNGTIE